MSGLYIKGMRLPTDGATIFAIRPDGMVEDVMGCYIGKATPAADVREVVLCKNCEFYMQSNFVDNHMECVRFNHPTAPDDFCSHGVDMREEHDD